MKKITIIGLVILGCLLFFGTCSMGPSGGDDEVVWTDVVYSEDYSRVTLYLDGAKVPVKKSAQRAMTTDLAKMAYDYLEVVFQSTTAPIGVARATWELGQAAGISGVPRNTAGVDYDYTATDAKATLFAGKKSNRTLLGVGKLIEVDGDSGTTTINLATTSVTFELMAIKTGLCVGTEPATSVPGGISSFVFSDTATGWTDNSVNSKRTPIGTKNYPIYSLKEPTTAVPNPTTDATYKFGGAALTYASLIKHYGAFNATNHVQRRIPRYLDGGRYFDLKLSQNTTSTIASSTTAGDGANFVSTYALKFTTNGVGAFSFYIEIPVYALVKDGATNGGPKSEKWWVRTGLGSELYSIDDGSSSGGSVLMGIGVNSVDWIDIYWQWVN
jgi:hypothetical protein